MDEVLVADAAMRGLSSSTISWSPKNRLRFFHPLPGKVYARPLYGGMPKTNARCAILQGCAFKVCSRTTCYTHICKGQAHPGKPPRGWEGAVKRLCPMGKAESFCAVGVGWEARSGGGSHSRIADRECRQKLPPSPRRLGATSLNEGGKERARSRCVAALLVVDAGDH